MRLRLQVGRTTIVPRLEHPKFWWRTEITVPRLYGIGIWIERGLR